MRSSNKHELFPIHNKFAEFLSSHSKFTPHINPSNVKKKIHQLAETSKNADNFITYVVASDKTLFLPSTLRISVGNLHKEITQSCNLSICFPKMTQPQLHQHLIDGKFILHEVGKEFYVNTRMPNQEDLRNHPFPHGHRIEKHLLKGSHQNFYVNSRNCVTNIMISIARQGNAGLNMDPEYLFHHYLLPHTSQMINLCQCNCAHPSTRRLTSGLNSFVLHDNDNNKNFMFYLPSLLIISSVKIDIELSSAFSKQQDTKIQDLEKSKLESADDCNMGFDFNKIDVESKKYFIEKSIEKERQLKSDENAVRNNHLQYFSAESFSLGQYVVINTFSRLFTPYSSVKDCYNSKYSFLQGILGYLDPKDQNKLTRIIMPLSSIHPYNKSNTEFYWNLNLKKNHLLGNSHIFTQLFAVPFSSWIHAMNMESVIVGLKNGLRLPLKFSSCTLAFENFSLNNNDVENFTENQINRMQDEGNEGYNDINTIVESRQLNNNHYYNNNKDINQKLKRKALENLSFNPSSSSSSLSNKKENILKSESFKKEQISKILGFNIHYATSPDSTQDCFNATIFYDCHSSANHRWTLISYGIPQSLLTPLHALPGFFANIHIFKCQSLMDITNLWSIVLKTWQNTLENSDNYHLFVTKFE